MTWTDIVCVLALYPMLEEYVFRLHGMQLLARRFPDWSPTRLNLATSLLFSSAHLPGWPPGHAAAVFLPSLLLGAVMQRSGRLWLCVVLHSAMNAVYLAASSLRSPLF